MSLGYDDSYPKLMVEMCLSTEEVKATVKSINLQPSLHYTTFFLRSEVHICRQSYESMTAARLSDHQWVRRITRAVSTEHDLWYIAYRHERKRRTRNRLERWGVADATDVLGHAIHTHTHIHNIHHMQSTSPETRGGCYTSVYERNGEELILH